MHLITKTLFALSLTASTATAQQATTGDPARGADLFAQNCAACHGPEATGDGPMAGALSNPPADLTALSAADGFPLARVVRTIDGRDLIAHGGPMPLFGNLLKERSAVVDDADGNPVFTSQAVLDIATWLATLQD